MDKKWINSLKKQCIKKIEKRKSNSIIKNTNQLFQMHRNQHHNRCGMWYHLFKKSRQNTSRSIPESLVKKKQSRSHLKNNSLLKQVEDFFPTFTSKSRITSNSYPACTRHNQKTIPKRSQIFNYKNPGISIFQQKKNEKHVEVGAQCAPFFLLVYYLFMFS